MNAPRFSTIPAARLLRAPLFGLLLHTAACVRPELSRHIMSDAHDLPCLVDDTVRPLDADVATPLGFAPSDIVAALGETLTPTLRRRPPFSGAYEDFDVESGFRSTARLVNISFDPDAWELVERPASQAENGSRGFMTRHHAPNGGPRPNYTCQTGQIVRGWATATAVFDHDEHGELTWDVAGWVEAQSAERDELVFLFADWRRYFWRMSGPWRNALKDEVGRGDWCPTQAQAVVEGQVGWGGWFSVHVAREECPAGGRVVASPIVDFRWFEADYSPW